MSIPFDRIASDLLARAPELLSQWQPEGRRVGNEWKCGSIRGGKGDSCSTNLTTGLGADFASGETWGDLIDLYAQIRGIGMGEAAKQLAPSMVNGYDTSAPRAAPPVAADTDPAPPVSAPPGPPDTSGAAAVYRYTDTWYVARHEKSDGSKTFTPHTWDGERWQRKAPTKPRPLFGLEELAARPAAPVLLAEGEKACLAARELLPAYVVMTWAGGASSVSSANWEALRGRNVDIWPDADEPGQKAAAALCALLLPIATRLRVVQTADAPSEGWDLADALADGWTPAQAIAWGKPRIKVVEALAPDAPVPRGTKPKKQIVGDQPTESGRPAYVLWDQLGLAKNDRGPYATEANALRIMAAHGDYAGRIWLDEFSQRLMIDEADGEPRLFSRTDAIACLVWMQEALQLPKMALSAVERASVLVGERHKRHPPRTWLESLVWDGCERLPTLLADGWGVAQSDYAAAAGRCWLVAMVARIMQPGCKHDLVPVFEGAQGLRKSSALRILGGDWFLECTINPVRSPKDFLQALQGKWLVEIPEIDRIGGKHGDLQDLTGVISIQVDSFRAPYAPTTMDYPRQCVLVGTANRSQWQPDETGGRRFLPVACGEISLEYLTANREQLFAEAVARYRRGESWWDVPGTEAKEQQEQRRIRDAWEEVIQRYITHDPDRSDWRTNEPYWCERKAALEFVTVGGVLSEALGIPNGRWTRADQMRVSSCLTGLGYTRCRASVSGVIQWGYKLPHNIAWAAKK